MAPSHFYNLYRDAFSRFKESGVGRAIGKTLELPGIRGDGTEFIGELSISAVKIKGKWHAIGIVRDISERKKMGGRLNEKLNELKRFHRVAVNRELKMIELKKEINELCKKCGLEPRYNLDNLGKIKGEEDIDIK